MTELDAEGRPHAPVDGDEVATLLGFLDHHCATLEWNTRGLDADGLRVGVGTSATTLGGLLKHMALVEGLWFPLWLHGRTPGGVWEPVDWDADPDWAWHSVADDSPAELRTLWEDACTRSPELVAEALADGGLATPCAVPPWPPEDTRPTLRQVLVHMIEEYARRNGHADLLSESVDGLTGE